MTVSMPSCPAMRWAVASLSPLSITTSTPSSCSAATRRRRMFPGRRRRARSPRPAGRRRPPAPRCARSTASSSRRSIKAPKSTLSVDHELAVADRDPAALRRRRSRRARARCENRSAAAAGRHDRRRSRTIAAASGCSDSRSTAATRASSSSSSRPSVTTSVTSGSPLVRVPVLSITTVSMRAEVSRAVAFLNSTPRLAPRPVPTMIAVGVASPSASGQVMTTTVIANSSAVCTPAPTSHHTRKVPTPPISATSTSQNAARSASRCPGALEFWASCTRATIWASTVSEPTLVARTRRVPVVLIEAPITSRSRLLWLPAGSRR